MKGNKIKTDNGTFRVVSEITVVGTTKYLCVEAGNCNAHIIEPIEINEIL